MDSPPFVPYQAYRSKRHSRNISNVHLIPNVSPPPLSRPSSVASNASIAYSPTPAYARRHESQEIEKFAADFAQVMSIIPLADKTASSDPVPTKGTRTPLTASSSSSPESISPTISQTTLDAPVPAPTLSPDISTRSLPLPKVNGKSREVEPTVEPSAPSSITMTKPNNAPKKQSTFRRVPRASLTARSSLPSSPSPLRPLGSNTHAASSSTTSLQSEPPYSPAMHHRVTSLGSVVTTLAEERPHSTLSLPIPEQPQPINIPHPPSLSYTPRNQPGTPFQRPPVPPEKPLPKVTVSASETTTTSSSPAPSIPPSPSQAPSRSPAPYRPGFQPKGVYRPRTGEFTEARKANMDVGRVERTKLERRMEKLIHLHFPLDGVDSASHKRPTENRRSSSLFNLDLSDIKNLDAGDLWKGVLQSQALQGTKGEIRAAEQRITPWQEDSDVSKCPLCTASFHPLTNRKHHCRLCGNIICSLPIKRPQRLEPCSILFVVDPKSRRIEQVEEGVDYGVRRRRSVDTRSSAKEKAADVLAEEEKFLKGVRICRECRPILSRQQHFQEASQVPVFHRLYDAFISLETEIEDSLPQFRELILSLNTDDQPTKEATATRKRLLEAFSQYDALSKRIRKIPCPPNSSQDRVQMAILTRANLFLQKNMFPLQSIPKPKKQNSSKSQTPGDGPTIDPDSEMAHSLQPLLEQEALLESFVEEAVAHRKFEDAKTLKANLKEIRTEIDKMLTIADRSKAG